MAAPAQPARAMTAQPAQAAQAAPVPTEEPDDLLETDPVVFGKAGQFAIGAERLFGFSWDSETETTPASGNVGERKDTDRHTTVSFLNNALVGSASSYNFARLAGDFFVIDGLSLGASLGYATSSLTTKTSQEGISTKTKMGSTTGILVAPRVGFAHMFSPMVGLWPRAGITYVSIDAEDADGNDVASKDRIALGLDVPFVLSPVSHVGFMIGPSLDFGFSGSNDGYFIDANGNTVTNSRDVSSISLALNAGMFMYF
jgi:hypothetical protein